MNLRVISGEWRVASDRQGAFHHVPHVTRRRAAFTLVEVMVALGIFFMAMFTILGLVSNSLRNARALQRKTVGCGMVAAQLSLTNKLAEGLETGDFGDMYPDFEWTRDIYEAGTNGIFQVDMIVQRRSGGAVESKMSILLYRPESPAGSLSKSGGGLR
jgi:general secretion pathway protein I